MLKGVFINEKKAENICVYIYHARMYAFINNTYNKNIYLFMIIIQKQMN